MGIGLSEFWKNVVAGVSGIERSPILMDSDCPWKIAGEVKNFHPEDWLGRKDPKRMDRFTHLGLVASLMSVKDAGIDLARENRERMGVVMGTAYAGWEFAAREYEVYKDKGINALSAYMGIAIFTGACGGQTSLHLGLRGPSVTTATGCDCSSSTVAQAAELIANNDADVMLAGGADAPIHPIVVAALGVSRALSERNSEPHCASRPYDRKRDGFVMSEGACVLVLEEYERACRRGAHIYAEVSGWASTCDGYHMCQPAPDGKQGARSMQLALAKAGVRPTQVDYVNSHGTSTPLGDKAETVVMKIVFGEDVYRIPISSIKSSLGHMQGACGAVELAACCLALRDNVIPPTINYEYPDPECDLDVVPNQARHRPLNIVMSTSLGFGGRNTAVVLRAYRNGNGQASSSADDKDGAAALPEKGRFSEFLATTYGQPAKEAGPLPTTS